MRSSSTIFAVLSVLASITPTLQAPFPAPAPKPEIQGRAFNSRFAPKARPVFPRTVFDNYTTKKDKREAEPEPVALPIALPEANPVPAPAPIPQPEALPQPIPEALPQPIAQPEALPIAIPEAAPVPAPVPEAIPQPAPVAAAVPNPVAAAVPNPVAIAVPEHGPLNPFEKREYAVPLEQRGLPSLPPLPTASVGLGIHL